MSTRTSNGLTTTDVRFRVRSGRIFAVSVETGRVISPSVRFTKLDPSRDPHPAGLPYRWGGQDYRNHYLSELDVWYLETLRVTRCSCIDQSFFGSWSYHKRTRTRSKRECRSVIRNRKDEKGTNPASDFLSFVDHLRERGINNG